MVFEFKLPDIGEGVHEGEISKWLVQPGQVVKEDQPMVEVMTDKVTVEITSPVAGTVKDLLFQEGQVVKVGSVIITIDTADAAMAPVGKREAVAEAAPEETTTVANGGQAPRATETGGTRPGYGVAVQAPVRPAGAETPGRRVLAAPAVRKLARTMGVDLALVTGSGPHGRIRREDVLSFMPGKAPAKPALKPAAVTAEEREERVPFRGMRRKIGEHLVKSKHTAPHFTYVEEADMTDIVKLRNDMLPHAEAQGVKLTYLPFIIKAVIQGLRKYPIVNSTLDEAHQEIILKHFYNIGVAVAAPEGLIVPVVKHADRKSLLELAVEIADLGERARNGKLNLDDLQGGTFTITSIGSVGGILSAPIINYPEVAIMGVQKIEKRPVVRNDQVVIREMTYLSISCDHRVVDGVDAALFMKEVIDWLEHPGRMLLDAR